jgi:cell division septal protein FtsQ
MTRIVPTGRRGTLGTGRSHRPAALRPGSRPGGGVRRTRPVRRASAGLTPTRAGALLVLLAAVAALYGAMASSAFSARRTVITGATWTGEATVRDTIGVPAGQNLFLLRTRDLEDSLAKLPTILGASVSVSLPDELRVAIRERTPLLAWQASGHRFLVDETGMLFGEVGEDPPAEAATLPVVDDRRAAAESLAVGATLDPVTLDAALRIGSLTPANVGSAAQGLSIRLDDEDGFTVRSQPAGWMAIFGFYTPTLRTTDLIPGQVRLLRSLIGGREDAVLRVVLADDRSGTFIPRAGASPGASPGTSPSASSKTAP